MNLRVVVVVADGVVACLRLENIEQLCCVIHNCSGPVLGDLEKPDE